MKAVNSDLAYDFIRKRILSGEYAPGRALTTEQLAKEINVSRTPVREALQMLKTDGLVSILPRQGASVRKVEMNEFRDLCDLRLALESHAAGMAALNWRDADIQEMNFALEAMRSLTEGMITAGSEEQFIGEMIREDIRFHIAIITAAKNEIMKKQILRLHLINRVVSAMPPATQIDKTLVFKEDPSKLRAIMANHKEIYEAIVRRDAPTAKSAMERHIQDIVDDTLNTIARSESGRLVRELSAEELIYGSGLGKR